MAVAFLGVPLLTLLPLGAAAAALVVLLYVLRLRHRPLVVPFLSLWSSILLEQKRTAVRGHLRRLLSLLIQLLLVALLLLVLSEPVSDSQGKPGRSLVVIVDVSASMSAGGSGRPEGSGPATTAALDRLELARKRLYQWLPGLGPQDEILLLELSAQPRVLSAWTADRAELTARVRQLDIKLSKADLPAALAIARGALEGRARGEVLLLSDGALPPLAPDLLRGLRLSFEPLGALAGGEARANVGISAFSARRYPLDPARFEVLLAVDGSGSEQAEVEVRLHEVTANEQAGAAVEVLRLRLAPGQSVRKTLPELSGAARGLLAVLRRVDGGDNWLPADDRGYVVLPERPSRRVLVVGRANHFLDAALLVDPSVLSDRISPEDYPPTGRYDAVIFDGAAPRRSAATGPALYLAPAAEAPGFPVALGKPLELFGFDRWDKSSRIFSLVEPYDIQVLTGHALVPGPEDMALGFSGRDAILVSGQRPTGRFVALGFDVRQSDFVLRIAWPTFLHNVLGELTDTVATDDGATLRAGSPWHLRAVGPERFADLEGPLGLPSSRTRRLSVSGSEVTLFGEQAGFFELKQGEVTTRFAASYFDSEEASTEPRAVLALTRSVTPPPLVTRPSGFEPKSKYDTWALLLAAAALISFSEWWTYHRRWTV